jgi:hypothetical protein
VFSLYALSLALLIPPTSDQELPLFSPRDILNQPLVELLQIQSLEGLSASELKALRSRIEEERDQKIYELKQLEQGWKRKLAASRNELQELNRLASEDTEEAALKRSDLHLEIASLERVINDKAIERERILPTTYELQLAKIWIAEHWPDRRAEIREQIENGQARDRRHGDAEDIGYRRLVKNPEEDIPTGEQAARQMAASGWLPYELQDNYVQTYVRKIAARIAANSDLKVPLRVTVLDSEELKVIAVPGGFLYVTSGVVRAAQTESEFAGVLSREIARIAAQHATRSSKTSWVSKVFLPVTQMATGIFTAGTVSPAAYYGIGYGVQGLSGMLARSLNGTNEKFEKEADQLGIQYAWKAGYDPRGFISFLDSIPGREKSFLNGEPSLHKRLLNSFSEIHYLPSQKEPVADSGEFDKIRGRLAR